MRGYAIELARRALGAVVRVALEEAAERVGEKTRDRIATMVAEVSLLAVDKMAEGFDRRLERIAREAYERGAKGSKAVYGGETD